MSEVMALAPTPKDTFPALNSAREIRGSARSPRETAVPATIWEASAALSVARSQERETVIGAEDFISELASLQSSLEVEIAARRKEAQRVSEERSAEERKLAAFQSRITSAQRDRMEALVKVQSLTRTHWNEVKSLKNRPPLAVRRAAEAVYTVMNCRRWSPNGSAQNLHGIDFIKEWPRIQSMLSSGGFVQACAKFDVSELKQAPNVVDFVAQRYFPGLSAEVAQQFEEHSSSLSSGASPATAKLTHDLQTLFASKGSMSARARAADVMLLGLPSLERATSEQNASTGLEPTGALLLPTLERAISEQRGALQSSSASPASLALTVSTRQTTSTPPSGQRSATASAVSTRGIATTTPGATTTTTTSQPPLFSCRSNRPLATIEAVQRRAQEDETHKLLARTSSQRRVPSSGALEKVEPLSIGAVEYASRACGVLFRWVLEVLREFFTVRELEQKCEASTQRIDDATGRLGAAEGDCRRLQGEFRKVGHDLESWRGKVATLRSQEGEVDNARRCLAKLGQLEDRYGNSWPSRGAQREDPVSPSFREVATTNLSSTQRYGRLEPLETPDRGVQPQHGKLACSSAGKRKAVVPAGSSSPCSIRNDRDPATGIQLVPPQGRRERGDGFGLAEATAVTLRRSPGKVDVIGVGDVFEDLGFNPLSPRLGLQVTPRAAPRSVSMAALPSSSSEADCVLSAVTLSELQQQGSTNTEDAASAHRSRRAAKKMPAKRTYLHCMSTPALPSGDSDDDAPAQAKPTSAAVFCKSLQGADNVCGRLSQLSPSSRASAG